MNVAELRAALADVPSDHVVVLSRDPEGNGYSLLDDVQQNSVYDGGDVFVFALTPELHALGFSVEDVAAADQGVRCVVLWPK